MAKSIYVNLTEDFLDELEFGKQIDEFGQAIEKTPAGVEEWIVRDLRLAGLFVRMCPSTISFNVQRKMNGKNTRRQMGLWWTATPGYPRMGLTAARTQGKEWLEMMDKGIDPYIELARIRREVLEAQEQATKTFGEAFDQLALLMEKKEEATTAQLRGYVKKWMERSPIWNVPLVDITEDTVKATLDPLVNALNQKSVELKRKALPIKWGPKSISRSTFNSIYGFLSQTHRFFAGRLKLADRNFDAFSRWMSYQKLPDYVPRSTFLPVDEPGGVLWLRALMDIQDGANIPNDPQSNPGQPLNLAARVYTDTPWEGRVNTGVFADLMACLLVWGTRIGETMKLEWKNVDFVKGRIKLVASTVKSRTTSYIPMTPWIRQVLERRKRINEQWQPHDLSDCVFLSFMPDTPIARPNEILHALKRASGLWITAHDLRRTVATKLGGTSLEQVAHLTLIREVLHHAKASRYTEDYIQDRLETLRPSYEEWEDRVRRLAGRPSQYAPRQLSHLEFKKLLCDLERNPAQERKLAEAIVMRHGGRIEWIASAIPRAADLRQAGMQRASASSMGLQ